MLAAEPDATISRIAFDCGFADPSYFTRRFQSAHGVSPSQFRQRN
jgi:AraC-like DNA-binding protein